MVDLLLVVSVVVGVLWSVPMSWSRAVLTGRRGSSTEMKDWWKGHCLRCSDSRQGRHTVWPHARETGGFLRACTTAGKYKENYTWSELLTQG